MASFYDLGRARSDEEINQCCRLVVEEYERSSYVASLSDKIYEKFYARLKSPNATTFFVRSGRDIIGTVTIIRGSAGGDLPMDEIYKDEVDCLRGSGKILAEVTQLAVKNVINSATISLAERSLIILKLFSLIYHYSRVRAVDVLCISINPKHELFYRSLGFKDLGGLKFYPSVNNAPALAKFLDLTSVMEEIQGGNLPAFFNGIVNSVPDKDLFIDSFYR